MLQSYIKTVMCLMIFLMRCLAKRSRLLLIAVERDGNHYIVHDSFSLQYGTGETEELALADYASMLLESLEEDFYNAN